MRYFFLSHQLIAVLALGCLAGCGGGIQIANTIETVQAADGFQLQKYRLFEWRHGGAAHAEARGVLFFIQGSEDVSVLTATERFASAAALGLDVVMMERRGVFRDGSVDAAIALKAATKQQRVEDHLRVIAKDLRTRTGTGPVILFGSSEGGDVAAAVAAAEPRITHLILMGSGGGWSQADELRELVRRDANAFGIGGPANLEAAFEQIRQDPDGDAMWLGHPHRRWSSFLFDSPLEDLLQLKTPTLLFQGSADTSVPVESARALRKAFAEAGKENLTYCEYADVDHRFMHVPTGRSAHPLIEVDTATWMNSTGVLSQKEADYFIGRVRRAHPEWAAEWPTEMSSGSPPRSSAASPPESPAVSRKDQPKP